MSSKDPIGLNPGASHAPEQPHSPSNPSATPAKRRRHWLRTIGLTCLALLLVGAAGLGGAEYYTAKPSFCGTCHVMDHQYKSWSHDLHGAKLGVRCVDCHYAPGERQTIMAKFKGLSQVASYFTGRYGASRPRAHVADASCMQSSCHGDGVFKSKLLLVGEPRTESRFVGGQETKVERTPTVQFFHNKHLDVAEKLKEAAGEITDVRSRLFAGLDTEKKKQVETAAASVASAMERDTALTKLGAELGLSVGQLSDARKLLELTHRQTRLRQLNGLSCTSCHNYDGSGDRHMVVNRSACYTCHFTNESFNRGAGECLRCHQPPTRSIVVHERATTQGASPVLMEHSEIVRRKIDCSSCHLDVVRGDTRVMVRDCVHCHDQSEYLKDFETRDAARVEQYHSVHVTGQRAKCEDCHRAVSHGLVDPLRVAGGAQFLEPIRNDCQHCHPKHHSEQVSLLTGTGGAGIDYPMPNSMMGSRLNCRACHTQPAEDRKGDAVVKATQQACINCHSQDYAKIFEEWKHELTTYTQETDAIVAGLDARLEEWKTGGKQLPPRVAELVERARQNVKLVRTGGGLHNKPYALRLLDLARRDLDDAQNLLTSQ